MKPSEARWHAEQIPQYDFFREYVAAEKSIEGPDPHLVGVEHAARAQALREDRLWMAGCYGAFYNAPTALIMFREWPLERVKQEAFALEGWCAEHWAGLQFRRERRAIRTPHKLARYLLSFAAWMERDEVARWPGYEAGWRDMDGVYGVGRYIKIKLLELFHRTEGWPHELPDLRVAGAGEWSVSKSPRSAMAMIYPEDAEQLLAPYSPQAAAFANQRLLDLRDRLRGDGVPASTFDVQVTLCQYKQSWVARRQFPGRSLDSELSYHRKLAAYWGPDDAFLALRQRVWPTWALGEHQGWMDVREDLGACLRDFGYTWDGSRFDYMASRRDLANPVPR